MRRAYRHLLGFVAGAGVAFGAARALRALSAPASVRAPRAPEPRRTSFTYRHPVPSRPGQALDGGPAAVRAPAMVALQHDLRRHGEGLAEAWPSIYEALLVKLHELAASDDHGPRLRDCFDGDVPQGLRLSVAVDGDNDVLHVSRIALATTSVADRTLRCVDELFAPGVDVTLAGDEHLSAPLHVTLILPLIPDGDGDLYAAPAGDATR